MSWLKGDPPKTYPCWRFWHLHFAKKAYIELNVLFPLLRTVGIAFPFTCFHDPLGCCPRAGLFAATATGALCPLFAFHGPYCGWFLGLVACFCCVLLDVLHQFLMMAIAPLSSLFSWLKGAPPGTYPSSCEQVWLVANPTGPFHSRLLDLPTISSSGYNDCHNRYDARSNGPKNNPSSCQQKKICYVLSVLGSVSLIWARLTFTTFFLLHKIRFTFLKVTVSNVKKLV